MSEKTYALLPTTVEEAEAAVPAPAYTEVAAATADCRRKMRLGFLKLSAFAFLFYVLFWMPINSEDDQGKEGHRHGKHHGKHHGKKGDCHGKNKHGAADKLAFEEHWQADIDQLVAGSLESSIVWDRLAEMTDTYGNRIAGSGALEKSIDWIVEKVKGDGLSVSTEDVVVDYWQRNEESLYFMSPTRGYVKLHMLGLGFSAPTVKEGIQAEVIVVTSKAELDQLGQEGQLKDRIVLYNKPFESYDKDVAHRTNGALWAQEYGALAALVRSIGPLSLQTPHAGNSAAAKIPAASISAEDAELLARSVKRHQENPEVFTEWPKVHLTMNAFTALQSKTSRNIIVELKGRERPDEVVVVGGHIDSWDVGSGAVDDGAGCFIGWETIRQLAKLDRPPRRTVRAVFWTSEENGSPGGRVYAANHPETNTSRHVFAFESDNGVFDPWGIKFTGGRRAAEEQAPGQLTSAEFMAAAGEEFLGSRKDLGYPGAGQWVLPNGGGADIGPLCRQGVACAQFTPADPFPLPYSTSPYAIKKPAGGDEGEGDEDEDDLAPRHGRHHRHGHGRHHHGYRRHHRHHRHHHKDDEVDAPRRPVDSGYFYYHHTEADNMNAFTADQVKNSAAVMAVWTYIAAESNVEL
ncbi:carboxypeptidase Q [Entomortierella parvispora]|uniref:Peptide hydrolase n=1 Tax=Entomortierella parvispora TaxID=205924 RepID=A0A9P3LUU3_9FUNG|nr:carboxypeptidase Q [Entomortierella parvispora]